MIETGARRSVGLARRSESLTSSESGPPTAASREPPGSDSTTTERAPRISRDVVASCSQSRPESVPTGGATSERTRSNATAR